MELAPCSQRLVDAFGIPDHLVAAPIATSAPSLPMPALPVSQQDFMPGQCEDAAMPLYSVVQQQSFDSNNSVTADKGN